MQLVTFAGGSAVNTSCGRVSTPGFDPDPVVRLVCLQFLAAFPVELQIDYAVGQCFPKFVDTLFMLNIEAFEVKPPEVPHPVKVF